MDLYAPEEYVVSRCLVDQSMISKAVRAGVRPSDFLDPVWKALWAVVSNDTRGRQLPTQEIAKKVIHTVPNGDLGIIAKKIVGACEYAPTSCYFDFYCSRLVEMSVQRDSAGIAQRISEATEADELAGLSADLQRCQHRLSATTDQEEEAFSTDLAVAAGEAQDEIVGAEAFLLPTPGMDAHIGGPLRHGSLIVVAAGSGNFKSTFLLQMFCRNAKHHSCVFMSLEMNSYQVGARLRAIGHGALDDHFLVTRPSMDSQKLIARIEELHGRGYDTFAIDYGQLVEAKGKNSLYEQQTRVANDVQNVTKRLGITTVVATQIRKQDTKGNVTAPPAIDDIRDTGRWREAPDVVLLLDKVWERFRDADEETQGYKKAQSAITATCLNNGTSLGSAFVVTIAKMRDRAKPYKKFYCQISERGPYIEDVVAEPGRNSELDEFNK